MDVIFRHVQILLLKNYAVILQLHRCCVVLRFAFKIYVRNLYKIRFLVLFYIPFIIKYLLIRQSFFFKCFYLLFLPEGAKTMTVDFNLLRKQHEMMQHYKFSNAW